MRQNLAKWGLALAVAMGSVAVPATEARAFQVLEAQNNQSMTQNALLHKILSPNPVTVLFLSADPFFVTVESDFSAEQNGIDKKLAEQQIAEKVYAFLKPIIEYYSRKPAVFLRPEPQQPADFPDHKGVANLRVYVRSNLVLSEQPYYQTSLDFKIFWMIAAGKLVVDGPNTKISEDEIFMIIGNDRSQPPYQYQCKSMNDCYADFLEKNLNDGLEKYFSGYTEKSRAPRKKEL